MYHCVEIMSCFIIAKKLDQIKINLLNIHVHSPESFVLLNIGQNAAYRDLLSILIKVTLPTINNSQEEYIIIITLLHIKSQ